jgi:hypothetical protein
MTTLGPKADSIGADSRGLDSARLMKRVQKDGTRGTELINHLRCADYDFPRASLTPKPTSMVPAIRLSHAATRGLARMRSAAKCVMEMTITQ